MIGHRQPAHSQPRAASTSSSGEDAPPRKLNDEYACTSTYRSTVEPMEIRPVSLDVKPVGNNRPELINPFDQRRHAAATGLA
jgi:hypothetical protein